MALNDKQEAFCCEYIVDFNATQAAIRAGYSGRTARQQASALLSKLDIQTRIEELVQEQAKRTEVTADRVVAELAKLGFADLRDLANWHADGVRFKSSDELTDDEAATAKKVKSIHTKDENGVERTTLEIEQYDKVRPLELLGKRFGIFTDRLQLGNEGEAFTVRLKGLPDKPRGGGVRESSD